MFYFFFINVYMYILLSEAIIVIEGVRGGGGVLARICFSDIYAKWCNFRQYFFMHQREDTCIYRVAFFETNGYLHRDVGEASQLFF